MVFGLSFGGSKNKYSQTANESGTSSSEYSRTPTTPDYWSNAYQNALGQYGANMAPPPSSSQGGLTQAAPAEPGGAQPGLNQMRLGHVQTTSSGGHQAAPNDPSAALAPYKQQLGDQNQILANNSFTLADNNAALDTYRNWDSNTIAQLERKYPDLYQKAPDVVANNINATRGVDYSDPYVNKYLTDVVDTSLADYDVGVDRQQNLERARQAAGGAFGKRGQVYNAIMDAEAARGRGSLGANLRYGAQDRAFGLGQQDAGRAYDANKSNVANQMAAAQYNAQRNDARTMFDVDEAMRRDQFRAGLTNSMSQNAQAMSQNANDQSQNILGMANLELAGSDRGFDRLFNLLGLGTSTFGEEGYESGTYDSTNTTKGKGSGFNAGVSVSG